MISESRLPFFTPSVTLSHADLHSMLNILIVTHCNILVSYLDLMDKTHNHRGYSDRL